MCEAVGKCILIAINVVFMVVGIAMIIIGALLQWGGDFINNTITPMLSKLISGTNSAGAQNATVTIADLQQLLGEYMKVLGSAGIIFLIIGAVLFVVTFCGICGVSCKSKILLIIYVAATLIVFLVMTIFVILYFVKKPELQAEGEKQFKSVISNQYEGIHQSSGVSRIIDLIQARLECCGVTNYTDFYSASKWNRTYEYNNGNYITLATPISCCKMKPNSFTPKNVNCTFDPTTDNSNFKSPCYTKLWSTVDKYAQYVNYSLIGLCVVLLILIIIAIVMIKKFKKDVLPK